MEKKGQKQKVNPKLYFKNNWQLYAMLVVPVVYMILFKYKPMLGVVVAFKSSISFRVSGTAPGTGWLISRKCFHPEISGAH